MKNKAYYWLWCAGMFFGLLQASEHVTQPVRVTNDHYFERPLSDEECTALNGLLAAYHAARKLWFKEYDQKIQQMIEQSNITGEREALWQVMSQRLEQNPIDKLPYLQDLQDRKNAMLKQYLASCGTSNQNSHVREVMAGYSLQECLHEPHQGRN